MDSKCFTCGGSLTHTEKDLARKYKQEFEEKGIVRYFFKTNKNGLTYFAKKESFNAILKHNKTNKNFEYAHISEFKTD